MPKKNGSLESLEQAEEAKRVTLAEWRANRLHELDLPSGLHVKVRDVTMTDLMMTGRLPDGIIDMAKTVSENGAQDVDLNLIAKNSGDFNQMLGLLVEICLVEPAIGPTADDEHILLSEIPADDRMAIFRFINREAEQLSPFREG
jgi:hypothetical protein